jgi:hypothetical protein
MEGVGGRWDRSEDEMDGEVDDGLGKPWATLLYTGPHISICCV